MRRTACLLLLLCVVSVFVVPAGRAAPTSRKRARPTARVVGTDDAGDWAINEGIRLPDVGDALGQDLVSASIDATSETLTFQMKFAALPGEAVMEQSSYLWGFSVDGAQWFITNGCNPSEPAECPATLAAGFTFQIARCEPLANTTPTCSTEGLATATVDAAAGTITVPVPMATVGAKRGSSIGAGEFPVAASPGRETNTQPQVGDHLNISRNYEVR